MALNARQKQFARAYLTNSRNATQAYKKIYGCASESARRNASKLLTHSDIQKMLADEEQKAHDRGPGERPQRVGGGGWRLSGKRGVVEGPLAESTKPGHAHSKTVHWGWGLGLLERPRGYLPGGQAQGVASA